MILVRHKDKTEGRKYEFVDVLDSNIHDDINEIKYIDKFWSKTKHDYQISRDAIKSIGDSSGGFGSLSDREKLIYVKHSLSLKSESDSFSVSNKDRISYNENVSELLSITRKNRFLKAMKRMNSEVLDGNMSSLEMGSMHSDIIDMVNKYINIGDSDLSDWITSSGKHTVLTGFRSKIYYSLLREQILTDYIIIGAI